MNEVQRQQYLEAIGIDSYMPRWILPLAPAPRACAPVVRPTGDAVALLTSVAVSERGAAREKVAEVVAGVTVQVAPPSTPTAPGVAPAVSAVAALAVLEDAKNPPAPPETPVVKKVAAATEVDPQFALSMWRVSNELLVIDSRQAQLALPTEALLANILAALGLRVPLPRAEVLHWPMYDHPLAPKGEAAAKEALMAMLEARLEQQPVAYLLLMGAEACHYLIPAEALPDDQSAPAVSFQALLGKALRIEALNATAIVVPSLSDMLQQPEIKASTWLAIQPLRQI